VYAVLIFNYLQHVHADEESDFNHSRNFTGWGLNAFLFNNGYHTVHHISPHTHWSENPAQHAKMANKIDPALEEKNFWWYMVRVYLIGAFFPKFRTQSMRLKRIAMAKAGTAQGVGADKRVN
jgi:fatty acid desaturase